MIQQSRLAWILTTGAVLVAIVAIGLFVLPHHQQPPDSVIVVQAFRRHLVFFLTEVNYAIDTGGYIADIKLPPAELGLPEWSPDGQWIAYVHLTKEPRTGYEASNIFLTRSSDPRVGIQATSGVLGNTDPDWSPSSKQLAFSARVRHDNELTQEIQIMDVDCWLQGLDCHQVPSSISPGVDPDWSADGKKLVFSSGPPEWGIYIASIDNPAGRAKVSQDRIFCHSPHWSPDNRSVVFICNERIYVLDVAHSQLTSIYDGAQMADWFPDGRGILFVGTWAVDPRLGSSLSLSPESGLRATALFAIQPDGTGLRRLTRRNDESVAFVWLPTPLLPAP